MELTSAVGWDLNEFEVDLSTFFFNSIQSINTSSHIATENREPLMPTSSWKYRKERRNTSERGKALIHHVVVMLCECHVNVIQFVMARRSDSGEREKGSRGTIKLITSNFFY